MRKIRNGYILIGIIGLIVTLYFGGRIFFGIYMGYPIADMDWNNNGFTSFPEIIRSVDVGSRKIAEADTSNLCLEYFSLKDGLPIKVVCK